MDRKDLLKQLKRLSKRTFSPKYRSWRIRDLFLYEKIYYSIKGKSERSKIKTFIQYLFQSIFGFYRTDFGVVKSDVVILGSDPLIALISAYKILDNGKNVVFYYYQLKDFTGFTKIYSERRYDSLPEESIKLICGDLGIQYSESLNADSLCKKILDKINSEYQDRFIFTRNVSISSFYRINDSEVASIVKAKNEDESFLNSNELVFFESFAKQDGFKKDRKMGRVVSIIKCNHVICVSQKTKITPRVDSDFETSIGDGDRETRDLSDIYYKDRNKDVLEALSINEKIRYLHGLSR